MLLHRSARGANWQTTCLAPRPIRRLQHCGPLGPGISRRKLDRRRKLPIRGPSLLPLPARARQSARLHAHPRRRPCHPALPSRRRETSRLSFCCSSRLVHPYSSAASLPTFFSLSRAIAESDERAAAAAAKCYPKAATCLWHTTLRDLRLRIALSTYLLRTRSGARSGSISVA